MKIRVPLPVGKAVAAKIVNGLRTYPEMLSRVEVAGSVRRLKGTVGDVEIVAEATKACRPEGVRTALGRLGIVRGEPNKRGAKAPWGERYYRGVAEVADGVHLGVDLFVVLPPAEFGVVYLIRAGSAEFSQAVVTRLHRWGLESSDGHIVRRDNRETLPCPSESLFFRYARLPWIPPELRETDDPVFGRAFGREWEPGEELRT